MANQFIFDGFLYALDFEFGSIGQLFHPGHLFYSFIMRLLLIVSHLFGYSGRALFLMQSANAWIGALAVAVLAKHARSTDLARLSVGFLFAALFGFESGILGEAIESGMLCAWPGLASVFAFLRSSLRAPKENAWVVGLLHGFLILFHQLFILVIPAFYVAVRWGKAPRSVVRKYSAT